MPAIRMGRHLIMKWQWVGWPTTTTIKVRRCLGHGDYNHRVAFGGRPVIIYSSG